MSTINEPATLEEIARVIGKGTTTIERWAKKESWTYSEQASHSRHKKRLYDFKQLPKAIQTALFNSRFLTESHHAITQKTAATRLGQSAAIPTGTDRPERNPDQRTDRAGEHLNPVPDEPVNESLYASGRSTTAMGRPKKRPMDQRKEHPDVFHPTDLGRRDADGAGPAQTTGKVVPAQASAPGRNPSAVLATDRTGLSDGAVVPGRNIHLSSAKNEPLTDDKQRKVDGARQMILDFIEHYPDSVEKACGALSEQFKNGSLAVQLVAALTDCNDKLNEARKGRLSPSTVRKWEALKAKTGHCLPAKTRTKTDWMHQ